MIRFFERIDGTIYSTSNFLRVCGRGGVVAHCSDERVWNVPGLEFELVVFGVLLVGPVPRLHLVDVVTKAFVLLLYRLDGVGLAVLVLLQGVNLGVFLLSTTEENENKPLHYTDVALQLHICGPIRIWSTNELRLIKINTRFLAIFWLHRRLAALLILWTILALGFFSFIKPEFGGILFFKESFKDPILASAFKVPDKKKPVPVTVPQKGASSRNVSSLNEFLTT